MKRIFLGKSDLNVSQLGLGCISFGSTTSKDDAFEIMDCYMENGGNFLDTVNNYAFWADNCDGSESEMEVSH